MLVPLCGKSADLLWLAQQGYEVTGVELSEIAARAFFEESGFSFDCKKLGAFNWFCGQGIAISIVCGDYFEFTDQPYDALYDRAALIALPFKKRPEYVAKTRSLLKPGAIKLLITLEYDQIGIEGPPYSVLPDEVLGYWSDLKRIWEQDDLDNCPPRFKEAGLSEIAEVVWVSVGTE